MFFKNLSFIDKPYGQPVASWLSTINNKDSERAAFKFSDFNLLRPRPPLGVRLASSPSLLNKEEPPLKQKKLS